MITVSNYNAGSAYSSGGTTSGISTLQQGVGIQIQNPNGPTATISNTGVISILGSDGITATNNQDGSYTIYSVPQCPLLVTDEGEQNELRLDCSAISDGYMNSIVQLSDQLVGATNGTTNALTLSLEAQETAGIRILDGQLYMGVGGTDPVPENCIEINTTDGILMTASNMTINTSNLPTLPLASLPPTTDNSSKIATTEWVQSLFSTGDVSSILLNGDLETYVVEEGVRFLDIMIIGRGGLAGITNTAGGVDYYGGAGGGGCIVFTNKFYVQKDQQFQMDINTNGGVILKFMRKPGSGTFETIATVTQASEGSPGNTSGAAAAGGGSATPSVPSTYCTWTYILGTTGGSGTTIPPSAAGYPKSRYFQEGAAGSGQLTPSGPISNGNIVLVAYK